MNATTPVLDQFLDPVRQILTPALAQRLAEFRADAVTQARVDELARKCNEGTLSPVERAEYEQFVEDADLIAILQAKARDYLAERET